MSALLETSNQWLTMEEKGTLLTMGSGIGVSNQVFSSHQFLYISHTKVCKHLCCETEYFWNTQNWSNSYRPSLILLTLLQMYQVIRGSHNPSSDLLFAWGPFRSQDETKWLS